MTLNPKQIYKIALSAVLFLTLATTLAAHSSTPQNSAKDQGKHQNGAKAKIVINAPLEVVWKSVEEYRRRDPERTATKLVSQSQQSRIVEEQFAIPTIFGTAECLLSLTEIPTQRIDFKLLQSDDFKAMEGSWILTPSDDHNSTTLELTSYLDLGMPLPRMIVNSIVKYKLERRLAAVKDIAINSALSSMKSSI
jgi:hypothetical protein